MEEKNKAAQDLVGKRWAKTTKEQRVKIGTDLAKKRWGRKRKAKKQ